MTIAGLLIILALVLAVIGIFTGWGNRFVWAPSLYGVALVLVCIACLVQFGTVKG